jgi:hypothetical protein
VIFAAGLFYLFRAPSTWPLIIAWAIAMGVASFGGLVILVRFLPRLPGITSLAVFALYGAVLFGFPLMGDLVQPIQHALMLSPVGSIVFFVSEYELHREFLPLALIPATIAVVLLPRLYGQLSRAYSTASLLESLARAQQSGDESEGEAEAIAESIPTVMAERLIRERWSAEVRPSRPWLDDFIHRNLSARERVVCFLLCGSDLTYWTQWWIRGSKVAMIPVALMFVAGYVPDWLVLIPAVIALMVGIPIFGGTWSGFADVWSSGKLAPFYAAFPVGFREISSLILKVNVIRILAWTPGILLVFVSAGNVVEAGPLKAAWFGVHFLFIAICIQPFMVIGKFSKGSSDSKSWRWPGVLVIASTFVLALVFLGLAAPLFFVGGFIKFAFAAGMVTASGLSLKFYRWGYDHVQWDLLHDAP